MASLISVRKQVAALFVAGTFLSPLLTTGCGGGANTPAAPTIQPAAGTYEYTPRLSIQDSSAGASIYYTTDGSTPTASSSLYSASVPVIVSSSETIKAIAISGGHSSPVTSADYTINLPPVPTPVFTPAPGASNSTQTVTITDTGSGAKIYYTTDGSVPTTSSPVYSAPVALSVTSTLSAIAVSPASYGYNPGSSLIATGQYIVLAPPVFSLPAGTYASTEQLTISDGTAAASIYYTTDGSTPTTSSTLYAGPITVSSTETVEAIAVLPVAGASPVISSPASSSYFIHLPGTSVAVSGTSTGGLPIMGGSVQLYAVGMSGYGSAATPLLATPLVTDTSGAFSLPGKYTCPTGSYVYVVVVGGSTTKGGTSNPNSTLAASLGLCSALTSSSSFVVNEATTVAAAYALSQFASGTSFGTAESSQFGSGSSAPADNFATSSGNVVGLANAMAISQIIASSANGVSPGNNSNNSAQVEWWQTNLVANMLNSCVRSSGGAANDGSSCGTLFGNVPGIGGKAPADTLQAALSLAMSPVVASAKITALYGLTSATTSPFQPYPAAATAITDFSMAIEYQPLASGVPILSQPSGVAIDSLGNVWVGNMPHSSAQTALIPNFLTELTPTGVPIQAGASAGSYSITQYSIGGTANAISGQIIPVVVSGVVTYPVVGAFTPSIDLKNNVWFNDRENSVIASVSGSGLTYSNTLTYTNGGNAGSSGTRLNAGAIPPSTYVDGNGSVWFNEAGGTPPSTCGSTASTATTGLAVFLNGNPASINVGSTDNAINSGSAAYIVMDPNKGDTVGSPATAIPGGPFVWTLGTNQSSNIVVQSYTSGTSSTTQATCNVPFSPIGIIGDTAAGDPTQPPGHSSTQIVDIPNPNLSGDFLKFLATPEDWTFDKSGNLWIANNKQINTTTTAANEILSSISKVTPAYGNAFNSSSPSNFRFSVFHNVAGMLDGSSVTVTNFPQFLTTDGAGNVWFALSNSGYVNAITNAGAGISPNSTATSNAGFAGSTCACTFNGVKATYQRPTAIISRPAVDQSGNVWLPSTAVGSNYVDVVIGIAVPRVNPDSLGLKSGTFATQP